MFNVAPKLIHFLILKPVAREATYVLVYFLHVHMYMHAHIP